MRSIVGIAGVVLTIAGCLPGPGTPASQTDRYIDVVDARIKRDIPALATSAEARADLEDAYLWRLELRGEAFSSPQLAAMCRMNFDVMKALAGFYASTPDRAIAFDLSSWHRLAGPYYKPCESHVAGWGAYRDEVTVRIKSKVSMPRAGWIDAAKCEYVLLGGTLNGPAEAMTIDGEKLLGTSSSVESYTMEDHLEGVVLKPNVVTRDVVTARDDQLALVDAGGDPMKGAKFASDRTELFGKCMGTTRYREEFSRNAPRVRLKVRAIAIGTHDHWDWTMWGTPPRRTVTGGVYTGGPL